MKILEITVRYAVKTKEEAAQIYNLLSIQGGVHDLSKDAGAKKEGPVAYTPSSPRTIAAAEALSKCKRVAVLRLEVLETWANAYPNVNLAGEIAKCESWAESTNKTRTARGWQKTLNFWLSKAQDQAKSGPAQVAPKSPVHVGPITPEAETKAWIEAAA